MGTCSLEKKSRIIYQFKEAIFLKNGIKVRSFRNLLGGSKYGSKNK